MLQGEHSAILLTFIKLPFIIKIFVLSIFEWSLKIDFTVSANKVIDQLDLQCSTVKQKNEHLNACAKMVLQEYLNMFGKYCSSDQKKHGKNC